MRTIQWLIRLANRKPLLFSLALLLIAISSLYFGLRKQEQRYIQCEREKDLLQQQFEHKVDSINNVYIKREIEYNNEIKNILNSIILTYKNQLNEQKTINSNIKSKLKENEN